MTRVVESEGEGSVSIWARILVSSVYGVVKDGGKIPLKRPVCWMASIMTSRTISPM